MPLYPLQGAQHRAAKCSTARWRPRTTPKWSLRLQEQGHLPVEARLASEGGGESAWRALLKPKPFAGERLVQFTQQLATLLGAGQPLDRALTILLELPEDEAAQAHHRPTCATRCAAARALSTALERAARHVLASCTSTWCAPAKPAAACTRRCRAWPITSSAAARCAGASSTR